MSKREAQRFNFIASDESSMRKVKIILAYESGLRGLPIGSALADMVEEAVHVDKYPKEVKSRLRAIDDEIMKRAVNRACKAVTLPVARREE